MANKPLEYKGHPLQRAGNIVYYGSMSDKYVIMLQIMDTKKVKDLDVATKVSVQLHFHLAHFLCCAKLHKRRLNERDQSHVGIRRNGDRS